MAKGADLVSSDMESGIDSDVRSLYKGGFILLIGFLIARMGGSLFKLICMFFMPVSAYGEVAVFLVLYNWFVLFATLNVTIALAKFVAQDGKRKEMLYLSALLGSLLLSFLVSGILFVLAPLISAWLNMSVSVIHWAIVSVPFAVIYNVGIFYLRGLYRMRTSVIADAVMTVVRLFALAGLFVLGFYYAPYMAFLLSFMVIDILLVFRNMTGKRFEAREMLRTFRTLLLYSIPIFVSEFLRLFSLGIDRLFLSGFYSTAAAGIYDVAVLFCLGYIVIANSYSNALLPLASSSHHDRGKRRSELRKALIASSSLYIVYTAAIMLLGQPVISIVNPAFLSAFGLLPGLALAYVMIGFLTILSFFANGIGHQRYAMYAGAVFAFLSLSLNLYLVPAMMFTGAVIALLASSAVSLAVMAGLIIRVER